MKPTHLDLFSGIGGFALAARWAGIETVQFVELDPFCQKVPTPATKDYKGAVNPQRTAEKIAEGKRAHQGALDNFVTYQTSNNGKNRGLKLQPAFVEWMMGWPIGWTDLNVSVTAKSLSAWLQHGKSFLGESAE